MGHVALSFHVMPESPGTDVHAIEKQIRAMFGEQVKSVEIRPIAFGLKAIDVLFVLPDRGGADDLERRLASIAGVASVEAGNVTLL